MDCSVHYSKWLYFNLRNISLKILPCVWRSRGLVFASICVASNAAIEVTLPALYILCLLVIQKIEDHTSSDDDWNTSLYKRLLEDLCFFSFFTLLDLLTKLPLFLSLQMHKRLSRAHNNVARNPNQIRAKELGSWGVMS